MSDLHWILGKQLIILAGILLLSWLVGLFTGYVTVVMLISLLVFILWHAFQFIKLFRWLHGSRKGVVPEGSGPWYPISDELYKWRKKSRKNRKKLLSVINEFRTSTEALADAVVVLDNSSNIIWSNQASEELLGISRKKDLSQRITHLLRLPKFIQFLEAGDFSESLIIPSPINPDKTLSIQITPYLQGQKLLVCRDISQLQQLERVRQDFVSNVSHELRTPLTVVSGYLEVLESLTDFSNEQVGKMIAEMSLQSHRMKNIVNELLYLAKMEHGLKTKTDHPLDMPALLSQLKQEAIALSAEKSHHIELAIDCDKGLLASFEDIHKVFSNLVFNAVRYTPEKGKITITWYCNHEGAIFSVTDTGVGISAEDIPRLTERFYRVDRGRARDEGGTGLGLAIVKHTLERYQARLAIKSELDEGSTFSCYFNADWLQ